VATLLKKRDCSRLARRLSGPALKRVRKCAHLMKAIRNAGGRSCWCRSRYSAISSSTFGVGPANTLVKNRCHNETPRLTVGASIDKEEAGIALSRQHPFHRYTHIASFTRMM